MSLGKKVFAAPARLWMNWPLWGGLLAVLLLTKHAWVLFAPAEHAIPGTTVATQAAQAEQLFGVVSTTTSSASLNGIRPIGIAFLGNLLKPVINRLQLGHQSLAFRYRQRRSPPSRHALNAPHNGIQFVGVFIGQWRHNHV